MTIDPAFSTFVVDGADVSKTALRTWAGQVEDAILYGTPDDYAAAGDGTTDDTTPLTNLFNAVNSSGGGYVVTIRKQHKITAVLPAITVSNVMIRFEGKGEFIFSGSTTMFAALPIGPAMTALTSRSLASNAARHANQLEWNDATSMDVGKLIRLDYAKAVAPNTGTFVARIVAKSSNTITLSDPLPWALTTATTFSSVTVGTPVQNVDILGLKASVSSYTGTILTPWQHRCAYKCSVRHTRTAGINGGGMSTSAAVSCTYEDHVGVGDGASGASEAIGFYGLTNCDINNVQVLDSTYFGVLLSGVHHSRCDGLVAKRAGSTANFVRGIKTWDCSRNVFRGLVASDIYGAAVYLENETRNNLLIGTSASALRASGTAFAAQGVSTNGGSNTDNVWTGLTCRGTDTTASGSDIAVGSGDTGQLYIGALYDTAVVNEATTRFSVLKDSADLVHSTGGYAVNTKKRLGVAASIYTAIYDEDGVAKFFFGGAADPSAYFGANTYNLRAADNTTQYGSIGAGGFTSKFGHWSDTDAGGLGFVTGAGGAVTQATSKSTGVTLNKPCGTITMNNAALAAGATVGFTLSNTKIAATDVVNVSIKSGATAGSYSVCVGATAAGSCVIELRNNSGGSLGEAVVLNFVVMKGVAA